ncbi:MAG: glucose 1-dehydrogenase [Bryobacterales bacterium]|nr:glucose 1-dehydrogenase [Bryobacterales bacterium]
MKAVAVFPAQREVRVIDHPDPKLASATQARMRVLDVGVCGTDRDIVSFQYGTPPPGCDYLVIGHESLSEVVEIGAQVSKVKPGDLVVMTVRRPCPHPSCVACRKGRQDFCYTGDFTERGIKEHHGYMTEFVVEEERYLNPVPRELREIAVLVEPLTIAEKSLEQIWTVQGRLPWECPDGDPGRDPSPDPEQSLVRCRHAVVLGAGPVGILGAMALKVEGFDVSVYSRSPDHEEKNKLLNAIGARYIAAETHSTEEMAKTVGSIDLVYEATGSSSFAFDVLKYLGPNAVFVFTGVPGHKGPIPVDTDDIMRNMVLSNQLVVGSVNAPPQAFQSAIKHLGIFVQRWPDTIRSVITGRFPIEHALDALRSQAGGVKNVVTVAS